MEIVEIVEIEKIPWLLGTKITWLLGTKIT
jgi:hypothetical protein